MVTKKHLIFHDIALFLYSISAVFTVALIMRTIQLGNLPNLIFTYLAFILISLAVATFFELKAIRIFRVKKI